MLEQQVSMSEIRQVIHEQTRSNFEGQYRRAIGQQIEMEQLTKKVINVLAQQVEKTKQIQHEIDSLNSNDERKGYIMNIAEEGLRTYMIQTNSHLFKSQRSIQPIPNEVVYDQASGLYMDQRQLDEEKRKRIMSIPDTEERLKMIAMNAHLF